MQLFPLFRVCIVDFVVVFKGLKWICQFIVLVGMPSNLRMSAILRGSGAFSFRAMNSSTVFEQLSLSPHCCHKMSFFSQACRDRTDKKTDTAWQIALWKPKKSSWCVVVFREMEVIPFQICSWAIFLFAEGYWGLLEAMLGYRGGL